MILDAKLIVENNICFLEKNREIIKLSSGRVDNEIEIFVDGEPCSNDEQLGCALRLWALEYFDAKD